MSPDRETLCVTGKTTRHVVFWLSSFVFYLYFGFEGVLVFMAKEKVVIASDHAGLLMKAAIGKYLEEMGYEVLDLGTNSTCSVDYPDYSNNLAEALLKGRAMRGVLICGTGIGISIAANRHRHVRAALCHSETDARFARLHNNANVLALGARTTGIEVALDCLRVFLDSEFEGGRHQRRVEKFS